MKRLVQVVKLFNPHLSLRCIILSLGVLLCVYLLIHLWATPTEREREHGKWEGRFRAKHHYAQPNQGSQRRILPDGEGVWVKGRHIQVMSAIYDLHFNKSDQMRVMLPAFVRHSSNREFYCCFSFFSNPYHYVQVPADINYIDLRFISDIQNGAFECVLRGHEVANYDQVGFAADTCQADVTIPLRVVYPIRRVFEFAVCTKVAYNRLEPQLLIEWFEYMQEMGASRVLTFHINLHPDSRAVLDYYEKQGLLQMIDYKPRAINGSIPLIYTEETAQTRQARHEKTLTVRDCQYRLAGYDFVYTIDFDEMPVPLRPYGSLSRIYETLSKMHPDGSAFRLDPILLPPEWKTTKKSYALFHWQYHEGTYIDRYCTKWMYIPSRTKYVATHDVEPKPGFRTYSVPQNMLHFLHFRTCKHNWHDIDCQNITNAINNEYSLKRFMGAVLRRVRKLPLESFELDQRFVNIMRRNS